MIVVVIAALSFYYSGVVYTLYIIDVVNKNQIIIINTIV